jgi:hypothetical protein
VITYFTRENIIMDITNCNFILRRYDKVPTIKFIEYGYNERVESVPFEVDGKVANTLFIRDQGTRDRCLRKGWKDETEVVRSFFKNKETVESVSDGSAIIKEKPKRGRPRKK